LLLAVDFHVEFVELVAWLGFFNVRDAHDDKLKWRHGGDVAKGGLAVGFLEGDSNFADATDTEAIKWGAAGVVVGFDSAAGANAGAGSEATDSADEALFKTGDKINGGHGREADAGGGAPCVEVVRVADFKAGVEDGFVAEPADVEDGVEVVDVGEWVASADDKVADLQLGDIGSDEATDVGAVFGESLEVELVSFVGGRGEFITIGSEELVEAGLFLAAFGEEDIVDFVLIVAAKRHANKKGAS